MKISIKDTEIEIKDIKNIYPSAVVSFNDSEKTPISLEWLEQNRDKVKVHYYAILILFKDSSQKIEIYFDEYEEMINNLKLLFEKIKSLN